MANKTHLYCTKVEESFLLLASSASIAIRTTVPPSQTFYRPTKAQFEGSNKYL